VEQGADAFVASILDGVAQPVLVADQDGLIRFANPAAVASLGYADAAELLGKPGHQTLHHKHPHDPADECPLLPRVTGEPVHCDDDWFARRGQRRLGAGGVHGRPVHDRGAR
jgi:PAS domain S-box-containing protein